MTPARSTATNVVVVDGSNIATEGRSTPSLAQLNDAVLAFTEEFPDTVVTVVVDATFGHRIDKKELDAFDAAVAHNELVAPPAGAIGRGDAFVLSIANKVGARVLSNDSFQEFHGVYPWLFEEGRLIGGKPVPYVGWVFVERLPVKGPISRKATRAARGGPATGTARPSRRNASKAASLPMPVPTAPPPGARRGDRAAPAPAPALALAVDAPDDVLEAASDGLLVPAARTGGAGSPVNDLLPFLDFVEHHPVGSSVNGVVESYASHGAYVTLGDVRGYVPLRLMGDPPPRSAREVMRVGDAATLVVTSFAPARRSIDLAVPKLATVTEVVPAPVLEELAEAVIEPSARPARRARKAAAAVPAEPATDTAPATRSRARKKVAQEAVEVVTDLEPGDAAPATPVPKARKRAPARAAAKKQAAPPPAPDAAPDPAPDADAAAAVEATTTRRRTKRAAAVEPAVEPPVEPSVEPEAATADAPVKRTRKRTAATPAAPPSVDGGMSPTADEPPPSRPATTRRRRTAAVEVAT